MVWIAIERLVGPHDHVVVPALIPERAGDLDVGERRRRVACQTLQFQLKPALQVAERFHQGAVVEVRFRVIRVDGQGALEAALGGDPIPLCHEHHQSQRRLCVGAFMVQRNRAKRCGFSLAERFDEHVAIGRLINLRVRQASVCGGERWIDHRRGLKRRDGVGQLEERRRAQMRPTARNELRCFRRTGRIGDRCIVADFRFDSGGARMRARPPQAIEPHCIWRRSRRVRRRDDASTATGRSEARAPTDSARRSACRDI